MFKIAFRGLLGKKKDTLLLWSVVALAFVFLVLSTTLIVSLNETDSHQRISTYGNWQVMGTGLTENEAKNLSSSAEKSAVLPTNKISVSSIQYRKNEPNRIFFISHPPILRTTRKFIENS